MIENLLFEIESAECIGDYKLADHLNARLVKIASSNSKNIQKNIQKKFDQQTVKNINFSESTQKFTINIDPNAAPSVKKKIKDLAEPFAVSFRYSSQNDPLDAHIEDLSKKHDGYIAVEDMFNDEPSDEDLDKVEEIGPLSDDPLGLDQFLFEHAKKDILKKLEHWNLQP